MPRFFNSSAIARAEYDPGTRILQVWFVETGGPYNYYRVPQHVYEGLVRATSKGVYFNTHIRDRYSVR